MKKIIAIALAFLMVLSFAACGNNNTNTPAESENIEIQSAENEQPTSGASDENTPEAVLAKFGLKPENVLTSVCDHTEEEYVFNGSSVMVYSVYACVNDFSYDTFYKFMSEIVDASRQASVDGTLFIDGYDFETMQKTGRTVLEGYAMDGFVPDSLNQNVNFYYNTDTVKVHVQLECYESDANRFHVKVENSNN